MNDRINAYEAPIKSDPAQAKPIERPALLSPPLSEIVQVRDKKTSPEATAYAVAEVVHLAATKLLQSTGDKSIDTAISKAGCTSPAGLRMRARRDALLERLPSLKGDSLAAAQANIERFNTLLKNL